MKLEEIGTIDNRVELENNDFVKTVLMILVVLYHSVVFWTNGWFSEAVQYPSEILRNIANWLNSFHIYGFTLVSGYLFFYLRFERDKYKAFQPFMLNKVKRLIIPAVMLTLIWVAPITNLFFDFNVIDNVKRYVLAISPNQIWFLWMLFFVFIIAWLLSKIFYGNKILGAGVVLLLYGVGLAGSTLIPNCFQIWTALQYVVFFWIGFKIRQNGSNLLMRIPSIVWIVSDVVLFAVIQFIPTTGMIFSVLNLGLTFLLNIVGALMAFIVLQKIANCVNWKESKVFAFLSARSMPVYLFHQQVIYFTITWLNGAVNPYFNAVVNFAVALVVSLFISSILLKFKSTRFLIGEK